MNNILENANTKNANIVSGTWGNYICESDLMLLDKKTNKVTFNIKLNNYLLVESEDNDNDNNIEVKNILDLHDVIRIYHTDNKIGFMDIQIINIKITNTIKIDGFLLTDNFNENINGLNVKWMFKIQGELNNDHPINLITCKVTDNSVDLKWDDKLSTSKYYQIMWNKIGSNDNTDMHFSEILAHKKENIYTISNLESKTVYRWAIMSYFDDSFKNFSSYSDSILFTTL